MLWGSQKPEYNYFVRRWLQTDSFKRLLKGLVIETKGETQMSTDILFQTPAQRLSH